QRMPEIAYLEPRLTGERPTQINIDPAARGATFEDLLQQDLENLLDALGVYVCRQPLWDGHIELVWGASRACLGDDSVHQRHEVDALVVQGDRRARRVRRRRLSFSGSLGWLVGIRLGEQHEVALV